MDLGPGILKGNVLERTGPKRYKLGPDGWMTMDGMKGSDELLEPAMIGRNPLAKKRESWGRDPESSCDLVFQHSVCFLPTPPRIHLLKMRRQRWHPFLFEDVDLALASFGLRFDLGTHGHRFVSYKSNSESLKVLTSRCHRNVFHPRKLSVLKQIVPKHNGKFTVLKYYHSAPCFHNIDVYCFSSTFP